MDDVTVVVPIPILPLLLITKGVESGFVESSTINALPLPTCVILNISVEVFPLIRLTPVPPVTVKLPPIVVLPVTFNVLAVVACNVVLPVTVKSPLTVQPVTELITELTLVPSTFPNVKVLLE